jgi:hypothetical protein
VSADELGQSVILSGRLVTVVDDNRKAAENELIDFFNKVRCSSISNADYTYCPACLVQSKKSCCSSYRLC